MNRLYGWAKWLEYEFRWRVLGQRTKVVFSPEVEVQLKAAPSQVRAAILKTRRDMERNPYTISRRAVMTHDEQDR